MKKFLSFLLVITLLMTTMLAGCGQKSPSSSANQGNSNNANSSTNTTTDLTLWTFVGLHAQMYNAAAKRWNETYSLLP